MCKTYGIKYSDVVYLHCDGEKIHCKLIRIEEHETEKYWRVAVLKKFKDKIESGDYTLFDLGFYNRIKEIKVKIEFVDNMVGTRREMWLGKITEKEIIKYKLSS